MPGHSLKKLVQNEAYRIVLLQLISVGILAGCTWLIFDGKHGFSVLLGGLAYGLPNLVFVWQVFRFSGAQQMTKFLAAFMLGEAIKLVLSAILFLLIVKYLAVSLLSVLIGFIGAIVSFWIICMWHFSKHPSR